MIELPYFSSDELWRSLGQGSPNIGFYTKRTAHDIPNGPGIYAWYLPIIYDGSLSDTIESSKKYLVYDSEKKGTLNKASDISYQWQNYELSLKAKEGYKTQSTIERSWEDLSDSSTDDEFRALKQIIMMGSIFNKPLYIGLTKSLSSRYEQHTAKRESERNNFNKRFNEFKKVEGLNVSLDQLIFMTVSLPKDYANNEVKLDKQLKVLEYVFKNITGPIFGEV